MSFVRASALRRLRRLAAPGAAAALTVAGLVMIWRGWRYQNYFLLVAGLALAVAGGAALAVMRQSDRFRGTADAPGVVDITEARVGYFGPEAGAFVDRDALSRIDLVHGADGPVWRLYHQDGPPVAIPHNAAGSMALQDLFASLPGFDLTRAVRALENPGAASITLWLRQDRLSRRN